MPRLKRYDILNYGHATIDKKFDSTKYLPTYLPMIYYNMIFYNKNLAHILLEIDVFT